MCRLLRTLRSRLFSGIRKLYMAFKQMRYRIEDGKVIRNIFDSEDPMNGWSIDEVTARAELKKQIEAKTEKVIKKKARAVPKTEAK